MDKMCNTFSVIPGGSNYEREGASVIIEARDGLWYVHEAKLQSFSQDLYGFVLLQRTQGDKGFLNLSAEEPAIVARMIHFMYFRTYHRRGHEMNEYCARHIQQLAQDGFRRHPEITISRSGGLPVDNDDSNITNAKLYHLAHRFQIPLLKDQARRFLYVSDGWTVNSAGVFLQIVESLPAIWSEDADFRRNMGLRIGISLKSVGVSLSDVRGLISRDVFFALNFLHGWNSETFKTIDEMVRAMETFRARHPATSIETPIDNMIRTVERMTLGESSQ